MGPSSVHRTRHSRIQREDASPGPDPRPRRSVLADGRWRSGRVGGLQGLANVFYQLRLAFPGTHFMVRVHRGELVLGAWQQIVLICHDDRPREREIFVQIVGN